MTKSCSSLDVSAYEAARATVRADASVAAKTLSTETIWQDGARAGTIARTFTVDTDELAMLGGADAAIAPMELMLAAVGTSLTIAWVAEAVQRGLEYRDLRIEVVGDYDLRGCLRLDRQVRHGFRELTYVVRVDTDAPSDVVEEIRVAAEAAAPVIDNITNETPCSGVVRRVPGPEAVSRTDGGCDRPTEGGDG